ncbi:MAG: hypothetical protein [Circular genetic element sp.]|nr:MAG: hypothetical protein [Circular genetic element sp.]
MYPIDKHPRKYYRSNDYMLKLSDEPKLSHWLTRMDRISVPEFIYIRLCKTNLFYRQIDGNVYIRLGDFHMAAPKNWKFIDVKLPVSMKPEVAIFNEQYDPNYIDAVEDITELGYKVSISYIDKQNSYVVSVSGSERSGYNIGCTLTSWSKELNEAIQIAAFKVLKYMRNKDWKEFEDDTEVWG